MAPNAQQAAPPTGKRMELSMRAVLSRWNLVEIDLHERFGIDVESGVLTDRTWRWLLVRILGLIDDPRTRIHRALTLKETPSGDAG